jgi:Na+/H+ antiporter NhaD/arsenite permease-like protein
MIVSYSIHDRDYVAISLLGCFLAATITGLVYGLEITTFIDYINFQAIIIIISMSIITMIAQDSNILEYIAIKLFKISKGNRRVFFYLICLITTLFSSIISGIIVILVLAPIIIRLCHFLRIRAGTFLLGMTLCVNIGSLLTPWKNVIISTHFNLDTLFFIQNLWLFSFLLSFLTIFIIDHFWFSKEPEIESQQKILVLELIDSEVIVENKKMFLLNSVALLITIILFMILPLLYLTAAFASFIIVIINRKTSEKKMKEILKNVEWEFIFFFIASYIVVGCLLEAGFKEIFDLIQLEELSILLVVIILIGAIVLVISFLSDTPTALIFIPIFEVLIFDNEFSIIPILLTFLIVINIGGNLLPQGSACDMLTLKIADNHEVENIDYKRLLKVGSLITLIHLGLTFGYISLIALIYT